MKHLTENLLVSVFSLTVLVGLSALVVSSYQSSQPSQTTTIIKIDGSDTVYPITQEVSNDYNFQKNNGKSPSVKTIEINSSGTSSGFKDFCLGKTDINNASRPIHTHELQQCQQNNVTFIELPIGFDAITIVVNAQNNWAQDITLAEIRKIWEPSAQGKITAWNQIRSTWPNKPLNLYGPDTDSGTFDYFTQIAVGKEGTIRKDYKADKNYKIMANKVSSDVNALAVMPYAYYNSNKDTLKALSVDSGTGAVMPSRTSVKWGKYRPFSRPLFIYVSYKSLRQKPNLREFLTLYMDKAPEFVSAIGNVPLTDHAYKLNNIHFNKGKVGTVFEGKSQFNLTLEQVLQKQAKF